MARIVSAEEAHSLVENKAWERHQSETTLGLLHTVVVQAEQIAQHEIADDLARRARALVAIQAEQIAAVRALHFPLVDSNGPWSCEACDLTYGWPCPTARALGVTA